MKNQDSLVSVIIPVFNAEKYLGEAIESVLNQDYSPTEIIMVNDGSTDGSQEVAKHYKSQIHYIYQENMGLGKALNRGLESARGNFFSFLDADDIWIKDKLSQQVEVMKQSPDIDMIFGTVISFLSPELNDQTKKEIRHSREPIPGYCKGTMLIRKESFQKIGPFSTRWHLGDFVDWYCRAIEKGLKSIMLPRTVLRRRIHKENQGIRERIHRGDYIKILKASLDRRRQK